MRHDIEISVLRIGFRDIGISYWYNVKDEIRTSGLQVFTDVDLMKINRDICHRAQKLLQKQKSADIRIECLIFNVEKKSVFVKYNIMMDEIYTMFMEESLEHRGLVSDLVQLHQSVEAYFKKELNRRKKQQRQRQRQK